MQFKMLFFRAFEFNIEVLYTLYTCVNARKDNQVILIKK